MNKLGYIPSSENHGSPHRDLQKHIIKHSRSNLGQRLAELHEKRKIADYELTNDLSAVNARLIVLQAEMLLQDFGSGQQQKERQA